MTPEVWGKYMWSTIHFVALGYPETNPSPLQKEYYKNFYSSVGRVLPCEKCSVNYQRHLSEVPIDTYMDNRKQLFTWTVMLHNVVNKDLGKRELTYNEAYGYYHDIITHKHKTVTLEQEDKTAISTNNPVMEMFTLSFHDQVKTGKYNTANEKNNINKTCNAYSVMMTVNVILIVCILILLAAVFYRNKL